MLQVKIFNKRFIYRVPLPSYLIEFTYTFRTIHKLFVFKVFVKVI